MPESAFVPGLVSVVIPAYNAAAFIGDAVESALGQTYKNIEVIVTNDGSTDDTANRLASFGQALRVLDQPNAGLQSARNSAIRTANGEYLAFLDADDYWHPEKIERQVAVMQANPECALAHTAVRFVDRGGMDVAHPRHPWHASPLRGYCGAELVAHNTIIVSSALVRHRLVNTEPFRAFPGCEDWDLWLRLSAVAPFEYLDEPLTYYRLHQSNMSSNVVRMLQSSIAVLRSFAAETSDDILRLAAGREWRTHCLSLASHQFDKGDYLSAREYYAAAGWRLSLRHVHRWGACWFPRAVVTAVRQAKQRLMPLRHDQMDEELRFL